MFNNVLADVGADLGARAAALAPVQFQVDRAKMVAGRRPLIAVGATRIAAPELWIFHNGSLVRAARWMVRPALHPYYDADV
jgi:hypothetical protein